MAGLPTTIGGLLSAIGIVIYARGPWIFSLGYGFANTGRQDDLVTMEVGLTVR
jgi:hypothetical protein